MALPFSRNTTYTPGSPVRSNDLNDFQDAIITKRHGVLRRSIPLVIFFNNQSQWAQNAAPIGLHSVDVDGAMSLVPIPTESGDNALGLEILAQGNGTADASFAMFFLNPDGSASANICAGSDLNPPAFPRRFVVPLVGTPHVMAQGEPLYMGFSAQGTPGYIILSAQLLYARSGS